MRSKPITKPRWLTYLVLGRVSNLPTVWTNCLAGVVLAGGTVDANIIPLIFALSMMYTAGMYLNDAFDQHFDRRFRAERPIPSGEITPGTVYSAGFGMILAGVFLIGLKTGWAIEPFAWSLLLSVLIVYYNYRHKSDPLSPLVMALCRVMVYFVSAATVSTAMNRQVVIGAAGLAGYLIGLTYVAKQENLKEVKNLWPLVFLAAPLIQGFWGANRMAELLFVVWVLYALSFLVRLPKRIPTAVIRLIAGIALLDAIAISTVPGHSPFAFIAIIGFVVTLGFQRFIPGT